MMFDSLYTGPKISGGKNDILSFPSAGAPYEQGAGGGGPSQKLATRGAGKREGCWKPQEVAEESRGGWAVERTLSHPPLAPAPSAQLARRQGRRLGTTLVAPFFDQF